MSIFRRFLCGATLVAASSLCAFGSQITQTFSLPSGSNATNWTQSGSVNQFDTSLGNLNFIQFQITGNTTVSGSAVDANAGSTGTDSYTFQGNTSINLTDPLSELILAPTTTVTQNFTNISNGQSMSVSGAPGTFNQTTRYDSAGNLILGSGQVNPLLIANYLGTGTIGLTVSASTFAAFSGPSYTGGTGSGTANASVTVIYDYTVPSGVPEPATMVLFGSALIGFAFLRKTRSRA
jgi:hypothetical protein